MNHIVRKSGIPVLAYPKCDSASPILSSLVIRYNESTAQATLCLQAQTLILQYDADNLVPGSISLGPATVVLPQARLGEVARHANPQMRTLSLTLKKECPLWFPLDAGPLPPQTDSKASIPPVGNLARAKDLHILFDYNWLHRDTHSTFQRLIQHPEDFTGFPVGRHYRNQYRCADWSVFNFGEAAATAEESEQPPPYAETSTKRSRHHVSRENSPTSPPPKRALLSPFPEYVPPSPTEENTPSPKPPSYAASNPKTLPAPGTAPQNSKSSSSSEQQHPDLHALEQALSTLLPSMLPSILCAVLPRLLTAASPAPTSPAPSQLSTASQISQPVPPPAPALSPFGISLSDHIMRKMEDQLENLYTRTLSHADHLRQVADAEFDDAREEERLLLRVGKEDAVSDLERVADKVVEEYSERVAEVAESALERMEWRADEVADTAMDRLLRLEKRLERERGWLDWEKEVLRRERREFEEERERHIVSLEGPLCTQIERDKRAGSAPV